MLLDLNSLPTLWNLDTKYLSTNHKQYFTRKKVLSIVRYWIPCTVHLERHYERDRHYLIITCLIPHGDCNVSCVHKSTVQNYFRLSPWFFTTFRYPKHSSESSSDKERTPSTATGRTDGCKCTCTHWYLLKPCLPAWHASTANHPLK
jgi:hypothetical protein